MPGVSAGAEVDVGADDEARAEVGRAIRRLGHAFVGREASPELLQVTAETLDALAARFDGGTPRQRAPETFSRENWGEPVAQGLIGGSTDRPFSGLASPWGLDLEAHRIGDDIEALLVLGPAHEGAPGRAHGGIVAGLFDDVFGFVLGILLEPAFTGELVVRYVAPTPLGRRLACRGRLTDAHGPQAPDRGRAGRRRA